MLLLTESLLPVRIAITVLIRIYCSDSILDDIRESFFQVLVDLVSNDPITLDPHVPNSPYPSDDYTPPIVTPSLQDLSQYLISRLSVLSCPSRHAIDFLLRVFLRDLWRIDLVEALAPLLHRSLACLSPQTHLYSPELNGHCISARSILGLYVTKSTSSLDVLKFDELFLLYQAFVHFREPLRSTIDALLDAADTILLPTPTSSLPSIVSILKYDLELLIDKQVSFFEVNGAHTPPRLREIMLQMALQNASLIQNILYNNFPAYHYLRYLENLYESNYNGALEELHRYFDYMVSSNSKYFYHFALVSRASLYHHFGELENALDTIEEAVAVARENKDNATLTFILSWLFLFLSNYPHLWSRQSCYSSNSDVPLLQFLKQKSRTCLLLLYSTAHTFETLSLLRHGVPVRPCLESLLKLLYIASHIKVPGQASKPLEVACAVYAQLGCLELANAYVVAARAMARPQHDQAEIEARQWALAYEAGDTSIALAGMRLLRDRCRTGSHATLNAMQIRFQVLLARWHLARGNNAAAADLVRVLRDSLVRDRDTRLSIIFLHIEVERALHNWSGALRIIATASRDSAENASDATFAARLKLYKCLVFVESGLHAQCLIQLMQALRAAHRRSHLVLVAETLVVYARALSANSPRDCWKVLCATMPRILATGHSVIASRAYFELARAGAHLCSPAQDTALALTPHITRTYYLGTLRYLALAIAGFRRSHHLVELKSCLVFEQTFAAQHGDAKLAAHADSLRQQLLVEMRQALADTDSMPAPNDDDGVTKTGK